MQQYNSLEVTPEKNVVDAMKLVVTSREWRFGVCAYLSQVREKLVSKLVDKDDEQLRGEIKRIDRILRLEEELLRK